MHIHLYSTHFSGAILGGELPPPVAPEWIQWDVDQPVPTEEEEASSSEEDLPDDERWEPFLQPRRKRARIVTAEESEDEEVEGAVEEVGPFPYPLGTKVAREFGDHGIFWGVIDKLYPDDPNLCLVRFTDGDSEDLDRDEIQYAIQLYEQKFGVE